MTETNERVRLLSDQSRPQYVFDSSIIRERKRRVKQFQCCLCVIFLCAFIIAIVVSVAYTINPPPPPPPDNATLDAFTILLANPWPLPDRPTANQTCTDASKWAQALSFGEQRLKLKDELEKTASSLPVSSPSYRHQKVVATGPKASALARLAFQQEHAGRFLNQNRPSPVRFCPRECPRAPPCPPRPFRAFDGSCNNRAHPHFGAAFRAFRRALPPAYADGVSAPRGARGGAALPSARTVSLEVHRPYYAADSKFSVVLAVWGQFLDHDVTATALSQGKGGAAIACCAQESPHPECFPVRLDAFDPYARYNVSCMEFVRSAPAPMCCLGPREQLNQVTAFIDGSVIYGVDEEAVGKLRTGEKGMMAMYVTEDNRTLLPVSKDFSDGCNRKEENANNRYCFLAGDARSNENLHLTSMHLIWVRQHNLLASTLHSLNPHWSDERTFQEARKIIGAQMQHITYREFVPILLGERLCSEFGLRPQKSDFFRGYNDTVDASIANSFAAAAFRFAHSIIPGLMKLLANDTSSPEFVQLHKMLFDPFKLYQPGELDRALRGAMDTTIEASDPYFTDELKEHLFEDGAGLRGKDAGKMCGLDLVSLNIQRGRDHGLVGYNSWREYCGLRKVRSFDELCGDMDDDSLRNIRSVYRDVDDVDLYTGAISEKPLNGSILGPTLTCLILDQFMRLKHGDRFWYENDGQFTEKQLEQVRKTNLAKIICDNSDNVESAQPLVMEKVRPDNQLTACDELPTPDFDPWEESLTRVQVPQNSMIVTNNL